MSHRIADEVATFCAQATVDCFPADVVDKANLCLVDFLSAALTFESSPEARIGLAALGEATADGHGAAVFVSPVRVPVPTAAYLTSAVAAATGRTDTHVASSSHPGMVVVPALLALSEQVDVPGRRLLSALVVGYEVMCRLGVTLITPDVATMFRPTGLIGPVAAAAACAHLLSLDRKATRDALSIAANAAGGLNEWARSGTPEHVLHSAVAARAGVESALLARHGFDRCGHGFRWRGGSAGGFWCSPACAPSDRPARWSVRDPRGRAQTGTGVHLCPGAVPARARDRAAPPPRSPADRFDCHSAPGPGGSLSGMRQQRADHRRVGRSAERAVQRGVRPRRRRNLR
jgi:hypothetical protein